MAEIVIEISSSNADGFAVRTTIQTRTSASNDNPKRSQPRYLDGKSEWIGLPFAGAKSKGPWKKPRSRTGLKHHKKNAGELKVQSRRVIADLVLRHWTLVFA